ncbi:MAG: hypothetical protein ACI39M_18835, partial [Streptomyces albidoflavus]
MDLLQHLPVHRLPDDHRFGAPRRRAAQGGIRVSDRPLTSVGRTERRHDAVLKTTGAARYTADITLPGMLHAKVLRSPHAHARIVALDA